MRVLVTFAVEAEFAPWRSLRAFRRVRLNENHYSGGVEVLESEIGANTVWILFTGIGLKVFSFEHAMCLQDAKVDVVVSSGLAGALKSEYRVGDVVAARRVGSTRDATGISCTTALSESAGRQGAKLVDACLTADQIVETAEDKNRLAIFAEVVDMESFHVMRAFVGSAPLIATIRAISDASDEDLPIDFSKSIAPDGRVRVAAMLRQLFGRPMKIPDLVRFATQSKGAARKLTAFLDTFVENLTPELIVRASAEVGVHE